MKIITGTQNNLSNTLSNRNNSKQDKGKPYDSNSKSFKDILNKYVVGDMPTAGRVFVIFE